MLKTTSCRCGFVREGEDVCLSDCVTVTISSILTIDPKVWWERRSPVSNVNIFHLDKSVTSMTSENRYTHTTTHKQVFTGGDDELTATNKWQTNMTTAAGKRREPWWNQFRRISALCSSLPPLPPTPHHPISSTESSHKLSYGPFTSWNSWSDPHPFWRRILFVFEEKARCASFQHSFCFFS